MLNVCIYKEFLAGPKNDAGKAKHLARQKVRIALHYF